MVFCWQLELPLLRSPTGTDTIWSPYQCPLRFLAHVTTRNSLPGSPGNSFRNLNIPGKTVRSRYTYNEFYKWHPWILYSPRSWSRVWPCTPTPMSSARLWRPAWRPPWCVEWPVCRRRPPPRTRPYWTSWYYTGRNQGYGPYQSVDKHGGYEIRTSIYSYPKEFHFVIIWN